MKSHPYPVAEVVDLLVSRHPLSDSLAVEVLERCAQRKGVTVVDIALNIWSGTPLPHAGDI